MCNALVAYAGNDAPSEALDQNLDLYDRKQKINYQNPKNVYIFIFKHGICLT